MPAKSRTRPLCSRRCCRPRAPRRSAWRQNRIILSAGSFRRAGTSSPVTPNSHGGSDYALHLAALQPAWAQAIVAACELAMGDAAATGAYGDTDVVSAARGAGERRPHADAQRGRRILLQTMGLRTFVPAGRRLSRLPPPTSTTFQELASDVPNFDPRNRCRSRKTRYPGVETITVAVMGCIVNGLVRFSARRHWHSLPAPATPTTPVFVDGKRRRPCRARHSPGRFHADRHGFRRAALRHRATAAESSNPPAAVLAAVGDAGFLQIQFVFDAAARLVGDLAVAQQADK